MASLDPSMAVKKNEGYLGKVSLSFQGTFRVFKKYWKSYGGITAVLSSAYFILAIILTVLCFGIWRDVGWWDLPISVLPNLIGFTLGGYAILLAFGDDKFLQILTSLPTNSLDEESSAAPSPFLSISSTFMHFLLVEIFALLIAVVAKSRPFTSLEEIFSCCIQFSELAWWGITRPIIGNLAWAFGFGMFIYAICLSMAATAAVFRVAGWFEAIQRKRQHETMKTPVEDN